MIVDQQLQHRSTEVSIILGDSILQRVQGPSFLSKKVGHKVEVKPFPGQLLKTWNPVLSLP